jgi:hypothetical protein
MWTVMPGGLRVNRPFLDGLPSAQALTVNGRENIATNDNIFMCYPTGYDRLSPRARSMAW